MKIKAFMELFWMTAINSVPKMGVLAQIPGKNATMKKLVDKCKNAELGLLPWK
jgi:hypothetical protein